MLVEGAYGIQPCNIAVIAPAVNAAFVNVFHEYITHEIIFAMGGGLLNEVFKPFLFHDIGITSAETARGEIWVERKVGNPAGLVHSEPQIIKLIGAIELALNVVHDGYLCSGLDVLTEHGVIGGIIKGMASGKDNIPLSRAAHIAEHRTYCIDRSAIHSGVILGDKRRKYEKTVALSVKIPLLAASEMVHEGMIVALSDEPNVRYAGIHHVGEQKVDDPVPSPEGHCRNRTGKGQFPEPGVGFAGIDKAECVVSHVLSSL